MEGDQTEKSIICSLVPDFLSAARESHNPGRKCHTDGHATLFYHNKTWMVITILKKSKLIAAGRGTTVAPCGVTQAPL